ncbi:MAG TPA: hypothetical protein VLV87_10390 [Gammaproteobacteria bacterium]|nr:hypothetical protein [Gammaproteobacteria bacterium]
MKRLSGFRRGIIWVGFLMPLVLCACNTREVDTLVGKDPMQAYPPNFMVDQSLMQFDESKPGVDWGLSLVWQGDHYVLSADQNITPNQLTQTWQIVAVQDIPLLKQGQMFAMGTCQHNGHRDSRIVAIVDYDADKQWFDRIEGDWAYDYAKDGFISYPTANIRCLNPRYGLGLDNPVPLPAASTVPAANAATRSPP